MKGKILFLVAAILFSNISLAEPASRQTIEKMFALTDMDKMMEGVYGQMDSMFAQMVSEIGVTEEQKPIMEKFFKRYTALIREEMSWQKLKTPMIDAYAKVFTEEEIKDLIKFYETPIGQKMLAKMPELMQASMQMVQQSMKDFMPKMQELQRELAAEMNKAT